MITIDCELSSEIVCLETQKKTRIADAIRNAQLPLGFSCGGRGACLACVVYVQGELSPPTERERELLARIESLGDPWTPRVACLARIVGPIKVRATYW